MTTRLKLVLPIYTLRVYESWVKIAYFNGIYDFSSTSIWTSIFEVWWDANYHILYQNIIDIIMAAFEMTSQNCKLSIQLLSYQISMQKSQLFNMIKLWLTYSTMLSWMLYSFFGHICVIINYNACICIYNYIYTYICISINMTCIISRHRFKLPRRPAAGRVCQALRVKCQKLCGFGQGAEGIFFLTVKCHGFFGAKCQSMIPCFLDIVF